MTTNNDKEAAVALSMFALSGKDDNCVQIAPPDWSPETVQIAVLPTGQTNTLEGVTLEDLMPEHDCGIKLEPIKDETTERLETLEDEVKEIRERTEGGEHRLDSVERRVNLLLEAFEAEDESRRKMRELRIEQVKREVDAHAFDGKLEVFLDGTVYVRGIRKKVTRSTALTLYALLRNKDRITKYTDIAAAHYGKVASVVDKKRRGRFRSYASRARAFLKDNSFECELVSYQGQGWMFIEK